MTETKRNEGKALQSAVLNEVMHMWSFLDSFLLYFHLILTLFNLLGWIWVKTRRAHLISVSLTVFSWLGLGLFYGIGYCPLTDLHWYVREKLGKTDMPPSYIKFVIDYFTGWDVNPQVVDLAAAIALGAAFCLAVYLAILRKIKLNHPHHLD